MTQPADWSQVMHDALGADAEGGFKASPTVILQNPWVQLSGAHWEEGQGQAPWNYAMPGGDWNMVTFYRKRTTPNSRGGGHHYRFQVFRGFIKFYDGGDSSAAHQAQQLVKLSQTAVDGINQNPHLDAQSFRAAADLFSNVMSWLENYGEARLRGLANEITDEGGPFNGKAADAFAWTLRDMRQAMIELRYAISGNGAAAWPTQLNQNAASVDLFKTAVNNAWSSFTSFAFYDPNWMVDYVVHEMERQVDQYDAQWRHGESADFGAEWDFTFPRLESPGPFNLMSNEGWNALNAGMQNSWRSRTDALSAEAVNALRGLSDTLQNTLQSMQRPITPHQPLPFPGQNDTGAGGDIPGGTGAGGDIPGGTGAGGDIPGGTGAGGDVPGGTGAGGDVPGGTGAGGDVPGGTGAGGDIPGGTGAGGDIPGGTGAGGDIPGGTGAGGDIPGDTRAGGDIPGGTGAGGDIPGGTGAGGDIPGGTGAGGDIPGGTGAGGDIPGGPGDTGAGASGNIPGGPGDTGAGASGNIPGGPGDTGAGALGNIPGGPGDTGAGASGNIPGGPGDTGAGALGNLPGGSGPGLTIPGLGLGGVPGAGSAGLGATGSDPNSRRGSLIGGLDNQPGSDSAGGGVIGGLGDQPGSALPSPTPLSPTGLGGGGFSRLSPGNNSGISIGPLGNPPPGYTGPGPLPGVPAGAGARALAGGSYGSDGAASLGGLATGAQGGLAQGGVNGSVGANGSGGYPFVPPMMGGMGGLGGQASEKERERTTWLAEDEEVWGTDPDCVAAVVGREDVPDSVHGEPAKRPSRPRDPARPQQPARTGQNRTGRRDT